MKKLLAALGLVAAMTSPAKAADYLLTDRQEINCFEYNPVGSHTKHDCTRTEVTYDIKLSEADVIFGNYVLIDNIAKGIKRLNIDTWSSLEGITQDLLDQNPDLACGKTYQAGEILKYKAITFSNDQGI